MSGRNSTTYRMCTRCVLDTSDPDITFDEAGVCSHCQRYDAVFRPLVVAASRGERLAELDNIVDRIKRRGSGRPYDCVVGMSGGVDSTFVLLKAKELGLRPLAVHFDSGWNSELAVGNIESATNALDVHLITQVVDWSDMRDLQLSFFKASVPNCDIPQDHAFPAVALRTASKYGIKYILGGYNYVTECMLPEAWGYRSGDLRHLKAIQRRFGTKKLDKYPTLGMFRRDVWYRYVRGIETVAPLNYLPYDKDAAKREIQEKLGWRDYGGKHSESLFTRYFQGQYLPEKFGYDKRRAHLSSLIVAGHISRDSALRDLEQPTYDPVLQRRDKAFVPKKLGLSAAEMDEILARPPKRHQDYPTMDREYTAAMQLRSRIRRLRGTVEP